MLCPFCLHVCFSTKCSHSGCTNETLATRLVRRRGWTKLLQGPAMLGLVLAWITLVLYGSKAAFAGGVLGLLLGFIWVNLVRLRSYSRR